MAISLVVHAAVLLGLACCSLPVLVDVQPDLTAEVGELLEIVDDINTANEMPVEIVLNESLAIDPTDVPIDSPMETPMEVDRSAAVVAPPTDFPVMEPRDIAVQKSMISNTDSLPGDLSARKNSGTAAALGGGTEASERAVALGLAWLVNHQLPNGAWCYTQNLHPTCRGQCDASPVDRANRGMISATAFALLPMLGCGMTHKDGKYKNQIKAGLDYITSHCQVKPEGIVLCEPGANPEMYHHALTTIFIAELSAMTGDRDLEKIAQGAVNYIVWAQDPVGGGWRYTPREPGDTSGLAWNFMALKSAQMGKLVVPPRTIRGVKYFLDNVTGIEDGAYYGYLDNAADGKTPSLTAIGLLCQMYMGWKEDHPALKKGTDFLAETGPDVDNLYYGYYATQVMHHVGGEKWEQWNKKMRDGLVERQLKEGHERGSWPLEPLTIDKESIESGGRLMTTALATMILEVYYRHLPLYRSSSTLDAFPLEEEGAE